MTPKQQYLGASVAFFLSLLLYLFTVAPTVSFWDCGEFIATSYTLGIPHPPGAPVYTLLGRIFSLLPIGDVAYRVNLLSVFSSAAAVALVYLIVTHTLQNLLLKASENQIIIHTGGFVAAFSVAGSTAFWSNATEAEVYALSLTLTLLAVYLALRWHTAPHNRLLFLLAYLYGLSAGVHLLCLLTLPGVLILIFHRLTQNISPHIRYTLMMGLVVLPFVTLLVPFSATCLFALAITAGLIYLNPEWRNPTFWISACLLAILGFSTYFTLYIRSGLDPILDHHNPETWTNLWAVLSREQYGAHAIFPRRSEFWTYQFNIFIKYFLQQFPYTFNLESTFRRAVTHETTTEVISYSLLPILLGVGGAIFHARKDPARFASLLAMFLLMGFGLVLYLNMPDPEPRERDYIFVGAYVFFGCWIGIGAAGLLNLMAQKIQNPIFVRACATLLLLIPTGIVAKNHFTHNRSEDNTARLMALNTLETCAPDSILFTNGDNDTYPLWYLQFVEGIRTDVRIVCLPLLHTSWYAQYLRDVPPKLPLNLTDKYLAQNFSLWPWQEPKDVTLAGQHIPADEVPTTPYILNGQAIPCITPQTWMIWRIVQQNNNKRPIYFSITVPSSGMAGLWPYMSFEGLAYRLTTTRETGQFNADRTEHNITNVYRFDGFANATTYKDPVARRLMSNYVWPFASVAQNHIQQNKPIQALNILQRAEQAISPTVLGQEYRDTYLILAELYRHLTVQFSDAGKMEEAITSLEGLLRIYPEVENRKNLEAQINLWRAKQQPAIEQG